MQSVIISSEETLMSITSQVCQRLTNSVVSARLLFISNSDAGDLCILTSCKSQTISFCVSESILKNLFNSTWGELIQLSSEMLRRSFSPQFQPTAEIKHNNSPVTSHLLQQLIRTITAPTSSHFLVKLQGPPNLKPDITICV